MDQVSSRPQADGLERARRERDLFRRLLELGAHSDPKPFLEEALGLAVEIVGAIHGYMEVRAGAQDQDETLWWIGQGFSDDDVAKVREAISRGIIAEALATGETIETTSARLDSRFRTRTSVRDNLIEAVLCAPFGAGDCVGAVYIQGRPDGGPFSVEDRGIVELFARHIAPLADTLLALNRAGARADATRPYRENLNLAGVIGRSHALGTALKQVALAAPLDVTVLFTGESGTGKSQLARILSSSGPRAGAPFVELNCAALPEHLVENELFGHLPGAYTGAQGRQAGKIAAAEGGTLFLDEVGELPATAQAKLLQLLQSGLYYPLGATEPVRADVRVIAATNSDLDEAVRERRFREDLYYRLNVLPIRLPSLREMRADIAELARHFAIQTCERHKLPRLELSLAARRALEGLDWPGNVRQLANVIEAAAIRAAGDAALAIERPHLFPGEGPEAAAESEPQTLADAARRGQRALLLAALEATDWNVSEAARRIGAARSHVYNLINAFGLRRRQP